MNFVSANLLSGMILGVGILAVLAVATASHRSADIHFDPGAVFGPEAPTVDCTISLELTGVNRIAAQGLLLYGSLDASAVSRRSTMLLSDDDGATWREVMEPVPGSAVFEVFFINEIFGWALVGWTVEGPGMFFVYRTENGGVSWQRLAKVPRHHFTGVPTKMEFSSEKQGRIHMEYCDGSGSDGVAILETTNGGLSWQQVGFIPCVSHDESSAAVNTLRVRQSDRSESILVEEVSRPGSGWRTLSELRPCHRTVDEKAIVPCDPPPFRRSSSNLQLDQQ